ncbi:hypothetical protein DPMN_111344 [Dreissena polymorpha]|uniref:Uncharacterized protein n=1 Tax=Dreissena polymorpha TaxID=45954 RepID=A0A9D4KEY0_DREPO|nr:hypothetical protein DPMN_111344 [Dreissena polymorpha]
MLMELLVHKLLSLVIAAVAMAILIRNSAVLVPSLNRVAPKYMKLVTYSIFLLIIVMSALLFVIFTIIFDFFVLTPYPFAPCFS